MTRVPSGALLFDGTWMTATEVQESNRMGMEWDERLVMNRSFLSE